MWKGKVQVMKLFFDTEFTGLHRNTSLISLGIVSENKKRFYAEFNDYNYMYVDDWIRMNVLSQCILPRVVIKDDIPKFLRKSKEEGYTFLNPDSISLEYYYSRGLDYERFNETDTQVFGQTKTIASALKRWLNQFGDVQFVSDVCHYDFVLLISLFGTAFDLPKNVCPACHDVNQDIARHFGISEAEAFDASREEIVLELYGREINGRKHNALYDAEVIKAIYEGIAE